MTRARILADYVSGGTTAAEFDYLDGVTSNVQTQMDLKAPITNAALVTPNLGTPSAGVVTNLSGVLPVGVTGGSGLTALGTVTAGNLSNSAIVYPAGHVIKVSTLTGMSSDITVTNSLTSTNWWPTSGSDTTYTPSGGASNNSTIYPILQLRGTIHQQGYADARVGMRVTMTGDDITNVDYEATSRFGTYDYDNGGDDFIAHAAIHLPPVTLDGTGNAAISFGLYWSGQQTAHGDQSWTVMANGTEQETHLIIMEVQ